jgi:tetratricopeptide (TPR) repeat protein
VEQWERPGIPQLEVKYETQKAGSRYKIRGVLTQTGTEKPFRFSVDVAARRGDRSKTLSVELKGASAAFSLSCPFEPETVVVDPDFRVLVSPPQTGPVDPEEVIDAAFGIVNNPGQGDPTLCRKAIRMLEGLLKAGAGKYEGLCHTGIGRCRFRLGEFDEAIAAFEKSLALGSGGPFHRAWIHLRLGCIADLRKKREEALAHYKKVLSGKRGHTARLAERFSKTPYRGYKIDG